MFFHKNDSPDPKDKKHDGNRERVLPLLPLRDIIIFPHMVVPLFVGREHSINALEEAMSHSKDVFLAAQKKAKTIEPSPGDIFDVGVVGTILQFLRLPDGTVKVLIEGKYRAQLTRFLDNEEFFLCNVARLEEVDEEGIKIEAIVRSVQEAFESYVKLNKRIPPETGVNVQALDDPSQLADVIIAHMTGIKLADRQGLLEIQAPGKRLEQLLTVLNEELEILQVEKKIRSRVKRQMEKSQKEYYLNEQMQAIQKELGEPDEFKNELQELEEKLQGKKLTKEALTKVKRELKKLKQMQPMSAEATVVRNYIDWILDLPWYENADENYDILEAERVLDEDHYGLKKPKERILEYLAVQALVGKLRGPILCFVGPPGVGKTSLAKSIARSVGRKFVRLSLGGVRDEAEIRGHRRTYIGAMPGRLIQSLRKVGANNPVFLLDEIDKMSSDFRGDPASALLEVLDPEQNETFNDHYLDLDYDLSDVMFITTANDLAGIPLPLRDRLEIIKLSGYTDFEKLNIAKRYLIPRQLESAGLSEVPVELTDDAMHMVIDRYTKESGVRNLEREIGSICRKIARQVVKTRSVSGSQSALQKMTKNIINIEHSLEENFSKDKENAKALKTYRVTEQSISEYLGAPKYRRDKNAEADAIGLVHGLAVSHYGGSVLECEVAVIHGKGKLVITGLLEKGMQESAQAAMSYIRSRQTILGLEDEFHAKYDFHVHFPEFVPKDGPSAGITMATGIASALLKIPVRKNVAMTGEITLRGRVMPIGGLKEKTLAAHRAGIDTLLIPKENHKDIEEIPERVFHEVRVVFVEHMDQVLSEALLLNDPDAIFGKHRTPPLEYRKGEKIGSEEDVFVSRAISQQVPPVTQVTQVTQ